jgi:hypothetical protein
MFSPIEQNYISEISAMMDWSVPRAERMASIVAYLTTFRPGTLVNRSPDERIFRWTLRELEMAPDETMLFKRLFQDMEHFGLDANQTMWLADALEINFRRTHVEINLNIEMELLEVQIEAPTLSYNDPFAAGYSTGQMLVMDYISQAGGDASHNIGTASKKMRYNNNIPLDDKDVGAPFDNGLRSGLNSYDPYTVYDSDDEATKLAMARSLEDF